MDSHRPVETQPTETKPADRGPATLSDQRIELLMGNLLRAGVTIAALVVLVGGILYLSQSGQQPEGMHHFHGEPAELTSIPGICRGLAARDPQAIIQFGLLLLVATPVARVAFALLAFGVQRNRLYTIVSGLVLALLALGLFGF